MRQGLSLVIMAILILLAAQAAFAFKARQLLPHRELLPPVPTQRMLEAEAFGDPQFLFRMASMDLQNAGDTGGRIVAIKNYDFTVVLGWLRTLQSLDPKSTIPVALAGGFYGQSQNLDHVQPIVRFIQENVALYPQDRWKYLYVAIYLAEGRLHDERLALGVAHQLAGYGSDIVPLWAAMTPAFILERLGDRDGARLVIENARQRYTGRLTPREDAWSAKYLNYLLGNGPRPK